MSEIESSEVAAAKAGDQEALAGVLDKSERLIHWWLHRVRWAGDWEDGVQEGRVGVLEAVERFDPTKGAKFTTYAGYRIRLAVEVAMKRAPVPVEEVFDRPGRDDTVPQAAQDAQVARAVELVGGDEAQLLRWRFWDNESFEEIGRRLGCHKFSASKRVDKALKKVQAALAAC
jgi:RNA polymerase sporulation-specific sigma factor